MVTLPKIQLYMIDILVFNNVQIIILTNLAINKVAYRYFKNSTEKWSHFLRSLKTSYMYDFTISRLWDARMWYQAMDHPVDWIHGPPLWTGYMDHSCGLGPWATLWSQYMVHLMDWALWLPCGPSPQSTLWTTSNFWNQIVPVSVKGRLGEIIFTSLYLMCN